MFKKYDKSWIKSAFQQVCGEEQIVVTSSVVRRGYIQWFHIMILGLQIDSSKTKAMGCKPCHFFLLFTFIIQNKHAEWVRSFKHLGVVSDDTISFTQHAKHVYSRANKRISIHKGSPNKHYFTTTKHTSYQYWSMAAWLCTLLDDLPLVHPKHCPAHSVTSVPACLYQICTCPGT